MPSPLTRRQNRLTTAAIVAIALTLAALPGGVANASTTASMQQPSASSSDDFERVTGPLGSAWVADRGTWSIASGKAQKAAGPGNNVATHRGLQLGTAYTVAADVDIVSPSPAAREWSGVVANVQGRTSLSYYVLRATTAGGGRDAQWQLLQMANNSTPTVLAQGTVAAPYGTPLRLLLSRDGRDFQVAVTNAATGSILAEATHQLAVTDPTRIGGWAGLYLNSGNLRARDFGLTTTTPAVAPPGTLNCKPAGEYDFSEADQQILETVPVGTTFAGMPVTQRVLTDGADQYVAYYDQDRRLTIAHRDIDATTEWTQQILPTSIGWDSHNYVSLGLDRDRNLHVSGNMHNVALIYFRTSTPGDITTLSPVANMVSPQTENSVTYPEFVNRKDGSLVFSHRNGGSGDGVTYFNVYDESSRTWTRLVDQPLFNGEGSTANPAGTWNAYFENPLLGPDGSFHMIWVWRDTPDAATNSLLTYAKSENLVDWFDSAGNPLTSPFRYGEADIVDPIPDGGGLLNGNAKLGFDAAGAPVVSYHKYDKSGQSQVYAARADGTGEWDVRQISDWTGRWSFGGGGSLDFQVVMRGSKVMSDGNMRVDFACDANAQSIVIDDTLTAVAQAPTPALPAQITTVRGSYPGLQVNLQTDLAGPTEEGTWYLRAESLPSNRDLPRTEWPREGSALELVHVGVAASPADTTDLAAALAEAERRLTEAYSAGSWAPFEAARSHASRTLAEPDATQDDVDDATAALSSAQSALVSALTRLSLTIDSDAVAVGGSIDLSRVRATGTYADGRSAPVATSDLTASPVDTTSPGPTTLTMTASADAVTTGAAPVRASLPLRVLVVWDPASVYTAGDVVLHDGSEWTATWWTRSQTPGGPQGAWQELRTSPDGTVIWTASRIFQAGDVVVHDGVSYEAKWWTRAQAPGEPNGPWKARG
ncbi:BNR-4 repeat-containing protein [Microbacterium hatanonis]|uniref:Chitin-binding type-3 domain-containing protein n=1 Tax=Microbacterium hatanonis TaxID=404366 RepID=A0A5C8HUW3_9MICO|nr:BNR-4 repeat-containing protein [Microbacterium hatanonis]TXK09727.1 hypothetical protein FVP77_12560 [Microbacterium hatanonis]